MPAALAAQSTNVTAPATTPTPPPAPAPEGNSVGPPQLRDFNLNGTVTRPAQPDPAAPAPTPRAASPRPAPAPVEDPRARTAPVSREPVPTAPEEEAGTVELPIDQPPPAVAREFEAPILSPPEVEAPPVRDPLVDADGPDFLWWPWLAALLAIALGAGLLRRRHRQRSGVRHAADQDALGSLVTAPSAAPGDAQRPLARAVPAVSPARARALPPSSPAPAQDMPVPPAAPPDGIFASRLKPELTFELNPVSAQADAAEGAALTFDLIVINRGSAPARDVLIEARLINANPQVDAAVGRFFSQPAGTGDRVPVIPPMSNVTIRTRLGAASADLAPLVVEGRKLFVPVVAVNAHYRWSGDDLKVSSSFLVGRGEADGGKMAPFRLDRGARSWTGLAARLHSSGLAS